MADKTMPLDEFLRIKEPSVLRVRNTAVYLTSRPEGVPSALLHNLKHNQILHERNVLVTVVTSEIPFLEESGRSTVRPLGKGFFRILVRYGFMERPDIPTALLHVSEQGLEFDLERTTFFVSREIVLPRLPPGMAVWRELFFSWMMRNAVSATDFFRVPPERVVELGTQVEI
jgi:KUP system potassium uptake protein